MPAHPITSNVKTEEVNPDLAPELSQKHINEEEDFIKKFELKEEKIQECGFHDELNQASFSDLNLEIENILSDMETILRAENKITSLLIKGIEFSKLRDMVNESKREDLTEEKRKDILNKINLAILYSDEALRTMEFIKKLSPSELFNNIINLE